MFRMASLADMMAGSEPCNHEMRIEYTARKQYGLTNDDNRGVFPTHGDVCSSLGTKASDVRSLASYDPRECGPVDQSEETNVRHALSVLHGIIDQFLGSIQTSLVAGF